MFGDGLDAVGDARAVGLVVGDVALDLSPAGDAVENLVGLSASRGPQPVVRTARAAAR